MGSVVYYVLSAGATCPGGTCPQAVAAAAVPVAQSPAPVVIYQAAPRPLLPFLAPKPPVFVIVQ